MIAKNIKWDTDGNSELLDILPKEVVIPNSITDEDEISDWLSDEYGFCHLGFDIASDFTKCRRKAPCFSNGDIRRLLLLN